MDWQLLRLFVTSARHRSLRAAAGEVGLSLPTLARRLTAFEDDVGLRLLVRSPRGLGLTAEGHALLQLAAPKLEAMGEIERFAAKLAGAGAASALRISATEPIIADILAPGLATYLAEASARPLELRVENRVVSLALNDADIAIRLAKPDGGGLMARRVALLDLRLYGSPAVAEALAGGEASAVRRQSFLSYDDSYGPIPERRWIDDAGVADRIVLRTSSTRCLVNATATGAGLAILPDVLAAGRGLAPINVPSLPVIPQRPIWCVWHRDRNRDKELRAAVRWIAGCFQRI